MPSALASHPEFVVMEDTRFSAVTLSVQNLMSVHVSMSSCFKIPVQTTVQICANDYANQVNVIMLKCQHS